MVHAEQAAAQVIMAVQIQKLTAQAGGQIVYPPLSHSPVTSDHRQDSVEGTVTALLHFCFAAIDYASCSHPNFSNPWPSEPQ